MLALQRGPQDLLLSAIARSEMAGRCVYRLMQQTSGVTNHEMESIRHGPSGSSVRDRRSVAELYEQHHVRAATLAFLLTGDQHLAQDLAQEAFIRVMGRFGSLRDSGAFDSYLKRTIVNLCNSHFRRARLERAHARRAERSQVPTTDIALFDDELLDALRALPHRQRAAIVFRYFDDQSEAQVAHTLGCSTRAVNSLVSRALATLRAQIRSGS